MKYIQPCPTRKFPHSRETPAHSGPIDSRQSYLTLDIHAALTGISPTPLNEKLSVRLTYRCRYQYSTFVPNTFAITEIGNTRPVDFYLWAFSASVSSISMASLHAAKKVT